MFVLNSVSGVSDYYANNDYHALHITKNIIANLNNNNNKQEIENSDMSKPPLYPEEELYGIISHNLKKNYDVREVFIFIAYLFKKALYNLLLI